MTVIKGSNVTVNWYKSTKTVQVQGSNEQMVKRRFDQLILKANHNGSQVNIEADGSVARVESDFVQVEIDNGATHDECAKLVNLPGPPATVGSQIFEFTLDDNSSIMSCPENLVSNTHNMSFNDNLPADISSRQISPGESTAVNSTCRL